MEEEIRVRGVVSPQELATARMSLLRPSGWRRVVAWGFAALVVAQATASTVRAASGDAGWEVAGVLWGTVLLLVLGVGLLPGFLVRTRTQKQLPQGLSVHLSFSGEGIRDLSSDTETPTQIDWENIERWQREGHLLIFHTGRSDLLVAPTEELSHTTREGLLALVTGTLGGPS